MYSAPPRRDFVYGGWPPSQLGGYHPIFHSQPFSTGLRSENGLFLDFQFFNPSTHYSLPRTPDVTHSFIMKSQRIAALIFALATAVAAIPHPLAGKELARSVDGAGLVARVPHMNRRLKVRGGGGGELFHITR